MPGNCREEKGTRLPRREKDYRKFARFVLFRLIKKRSFNILCVLDIFFSGRWQSTLLKFFFLFSCFILIPVSAVTTFVVYWVLISHIELISTLKKKKAKEEKDLSNLPP